MIASGPLIAYRASRAPLRGGAAAATIALCVAITMQQLVVGAGAAAQQQRAAAAAPAPGIAEPAPSAEAGGSPPLASAWAATRGSAHLPIPNILEKPGEGAAAGSTRAAAAAGDTTEAGPAASCADDAAAAPPAPANIYSGASTNPERNSYVPAVTT